MKIKFNTTHRRKLADEIGNVLGAIPNYQKLPTFAYKIGDCILDKEGTLCIPDTVDSTVVNKLVEHLSNLGFIGETEQNNILTISIPRDILTDVGLSNLNQIIENKKSLFLKAFNTDSLKINIADEKISFPWFEYTTEHIEIKAYTEFISRLCDMANSQKSVSAKPTTTSNEKYTFRTFLIRLNLIGNEHKTTRKILLRNLMGSSAFRNK